MFRRGWLLGRSGLTIAAAADAVVEEGSVEAVVGGGRGCRGGSEGAAAVVVALVRADDGAAIGDLR